MMACLKSIFEQLKPGGKFFFETTPPEAEFYSKNPKLWADYQERQKAGIAGPWTIKSRDYLDEEWWGMPLITLATLEEATRCCEEVGFVVDEARTDFMTLHACYDEVIGVISTKPLA
jgi:hypothetical protein